MPRFTTETGSWFLDGDPKLQNIRYSFKIDEELFDGESEFQKILMFKNGKLGSVMVLNEQVQCTQKDEFTYQEMMAHLPLTCHKNPQKVLVIGGGDGGVVREALKHDSVTSVVLCEIDQKVIDLCRKYLPTMTCDLDDPRVTVQVGDGIKYVKNHTAEFDVIITDPSCSWDIAEGLFENEFYQDLKNALRPNGVVCLNGETVWQDRILAKRVVRECKEIFSSVEYGIGQVPSYSTGSMGYILCTTDPTVTLTKPTRVLSEDQMKKMKLKYYSPEIHEAAFVLPYFLQKFFKKQYDPILDERRKAYLDMIKAQKE